MDLESIWKSACSLLESRMNYLAYTTWIQDNMYPVMLEDDTVVISAKMEPLIPMIQKKYQSVIESCLTEADAELLTNVRLAYEKRIRVGCTGCEYCMPCPQGINIPRIFRGYDQASMFDSFEAFFARYKKDNAENPCVSCGACVAACPQHFKTPIYEMLANIYEESKQY